MINRSFGECEKNSTCSGFEIKVVCANHVITITLTIHQLQQEYLSLIYNRETVPSSLLVAKFVAKPLEMLAKVP